MTLKQKIYAHCRHLLQQKLQALQNDLHELQESAAEETKSTAGDKHETALAMLQIEQENRQRQIDEARDQLAALERTDISVVSENAVAGSLLQTDKGLLFISVGLGKIKVDDQTVIVLSPLSPLGKKLLQRTVSDAVEMNGTVYNIEAIY